MLSAARRPCLAADPRGTVTFNASFFSVAKGSTAVTTVCTTSFME